MIICEVVGHVWATKKDDSLQGLKLLVVRQTDHYSDIDFPTFVAIDNIGAGIGEIVLVVQGSSARKVLDKDSVAIDATVVGIIDSVEVEKALRSS